MNATIQSVHFTASEQLEQFVNVKINKLVQYNDGIIGADVTLKLEKPEAIDNKIAEISIKIPGETLFAKKQADSFEEATDLACEALRKQLLKVKEKSNSK